MAEPGKAEKWKLFTFIVFMYTIISIISEILLFLGVLTRRFHIFVYMQNPMALPVRAPATENSEEGGSQSVKVQLRLREMVLAGELPAGTRIAEMSIVEKLGVSRTPIRAALMRLEQEGLLVTLPNGGYAIRTFSERDAVDAIELRGTIEGLAVRLAAERGAAPVVLGEARECLDRIDTLLRETALNDEAFSSYVRLNQKFHSLVTELSESAVIVRELDKVASLPFASPSGFVVVRANSPRARDMLIVAQDQHRQVLDAIERREGARAESIMREHARLAQRNLREALRSPDSDAVPGMRLIRKRNGSPDQT